MLDMVDINTNDTDINKYSIKFLRVNIRILNKEFLKSSDVTNIGSIPIYSEE